jgi:hypothetical protein
MDIKELRTIAEDARAAEDAATVALRSKTAIRQDAVTAYNRALAAEAGIEERKTIFSVEVWGRKFRVVMDRPSGRWIGEIAVRDVTSKNRVWQGRRPLVVSLTAVSDIEGPLFNDD